MSEIAKAMGHRIRSYRTQKGWSQEKLAELSGCHPTYIGQIERGEKNATVESVEKIAAALDLPLEVLFEKLGKAPGQAEPNEIPLKCYNFLLTKSEAEQALLFSILQDIDRYRKT